ncbi:uncharacterized protein VSU04_009783 [Chlamydotis macqueenii]
MVKGSCNPAFGRGGGSGGSAKPAAPRPWAASGTAARCCAARRGARPPPQPQPARAPLAACPPALLLVGCPGPACRLYTPRSRPGDRPLVSNLWPPRSRVLAPRRGRAARPPPGAAGGERPARPGPRRRAGSSLINGAGTSLPPCPGPLGGGRYISTARSHPCAERSDPAAPRRRLRKSQSSPSPARTCTYLAGREHSPRRCLPAGPEPQLDRRRALSAARLHRRDPRGSPAPSRTHGARSRAALGPVRGWLPAGRGGDLGGQRELPGSAPRRPPSRSAKPGGAALPGRDGGPAALAARKKGGISARVSPVTLRTNQAAQQQCLEGVLPRSTGSSRAV